MRYLRVYICGRDRRHICVLFDSSPQFRYGGTHLKLERDRETTIACDPYLLPSIVFCPLTSAKRLPQLTFPDICIYLIHNPSPYSRDSLKALKSMDAYLYAVAGCVKESQIWHLEPKKLYVITAHVNNSMTVFKRVVLVVVYR